MRHLKSSALALLTLCSAHALADSPIYAVSHVDIEPGQVTTALTLLRTFAYQARHDPDVVHLDVLEQTDAKNHFTLVEVLRSPAAYDRFVQQGYVKQMRIQLQPLLGSPCDERLHAEVPGGA